MAGSNVLTNDAPTTTAQYRRAVARIIRDLQAMHGLTDLEFAERVGCSIGTVRNARNEESDLGAVWLARIEQRFGAGSIDPYLNLAGARSVPLRTSDSDALPSATAAIHRIALARSPESPGGEAITHCELLEMEPVIVDAIRALTALKLRCNEIRSAA